MDKLDTSDSGALTEDDAHSPLFKESQKAKFFLSATVFLYIAWNGLFD